MIPKTILVGNGPSVRGKASLIDSFQTVVRFNSYVLGDDAGRKTDVWAHKWGTKFPIPDPTPKRRLLLCPWATEEHGAVWQDQREYARDTGLEYLARETAEFADVYFGRRYWPSTGALALAHFANQGPVVLTGFDHFLGDEMHYGDECAFPACHDPEKEKQWTRFFVWLGIAERL